MDTTAVVVIGILVLAIALVAILFRRGSFKAGFKGPLNTSFDVEGQNPAAAATRTGEDDPGSRDSPTAGRSSSAASAISRRCWRAPATRA